MIATNADPAWAPRPLLAVGVRLLQYGLPLLAGTAVTWLLAPVLTAVAPVAMASLLALLAAVVVSLLASRVTMRLAPLAVLLQMTMIFPDHAPSRLKVARQSTSSEEIRRQLISEDADEQQAAVTLLGLVTALGQHDRRTRGHSERVRLFCDLLADELGLSEADSGRLRWAALIHDVGKLEVSAAVLRKPDRLDEREWSQVRLHPEAGARLARPLEAWLGPWFAGILDHHERYDGLGYPRGLVGDQISVAGRAVCVVDAFETMTAARSYKAAVSSVAARAELARCAGSHFDPTMVRAFLAITLPRLLWSVGPLAFVVNAPFLRWVGDGGVRFAQAASTTATGAANAAGVTAVVVATGTLPAASVPAAPEGHAPATVRVIDRPEEAVGADSGTGVVRTAELGLATPTGPAARGSAAASGSVTATPARATPVRATPAHGAASTWAGRGVSPAARPAVRRSDAAEVSRDDGSTPEGDSSKRSSGSDSSKDGRGEGGHGTDD